MDGDEFPPCRKENDLARSLLVLGSNSDRNEPPFNRDTGWLRAIFRDAKLPFQLGGRRVGEVDDDDGVILTVDGEKTFRNRIVIDHLRRPRIKGSEFDCGKVR